jgi:PAS domain S-box-containing protein
VFRITALSIRSLLLLITFVVALPAAGIILYSGLQFRSAMLEDASREMLKLADRIATEQQNLVAGAEQLMTALAQLPEVRGREAARVEPVLRELRKLNPMYSNIFIADQEGRVWATAVPVPPPFVVADRRYFKNALASGQLSSGEYVLSRATTRPAFNLAYPLKDDRGAVIGVISVGFVIDRYRQLLEQMRLPVGTSFVLMDHHGVILSRGVDPEPYIGKPYPVAEFRKIQEGEDTGIATRTGLAGDRRIISHRKLRLAGESAPYMYLTTGIPVDVATREASRALRHNVAMLMSLLVVAYAMAVLIGSRAIVARVKLLENASRRLAAGNLNVRVSDLVVGGELGRLGKTFDTMAEQLATREAERLKAAEERDRLVSILETTTDVVSMVSPEGRIFYLNHAGRMLTGVEAQSAADVSLSQVHPAWAAERVMGEGIPAAIRDGVWEGETALLDGHGGEVPVSQVILSHRDAQGKLSHLSTIMRDISERKAAEAENTLLTRQLIQAQKMESIGQLAGGVAHDFNNLLTPIIGYSELLEVDLSGDQAALAKVGNVLKAAQKAKELVRQLLTFSRKQVLQMEVIDLNQVITAFHGILRHTIRESIVIRLDLAGEAHSIRADRNQIEQVLMNLAVNAQDAIGERGTITIETVFVLLDDAYARQHPEVAPGRHLMLAVTDDGCGMDQETRQRIFEPFFTTKGVGKGTGLGLATVYGIVRQHGGNIWVYSEPGQGSTFKCYFPLVDEPPAGEAPATREELSLAGNRRTILLVEDNDMIRILVDDLLTRQGFEVLVAEDPVQALRISRGRTLDLLITDVVMPHMTGPELHATLLEDYPGLKVLYMSGYTSNVIAQQRMLGEGMRYLQKPFAIAEFMRIAEALLKP